MARLLAYWLFYKYILSKELTIEVIKSFKPIQNNLIFPIILLSFGFELFNKPFFSLYSEIFKPNEVLKTVRIHHQNAELNFRYILFSFSILIIAPIFEELIFRKYLLGNLLKQNSVLKSIFISSLCFSLFHLPDFRNILPTFIFGIITAFIYLKTKKITYTIFFHFISNLIFIILNLNGATIFENLEKLHFNILYWMLTSFGGSLIILISLKFFNKNLEKEKIEV